MGLEPVTLETWKIGHIRREMNWVAVLTQSSRFFMNIGIFLAPWDFKIFESWVMVCSKIWGGHMSILVITTITGTLRARAMPKCSLDMPMRPLFAATINKA